MKQVFIAIDQLANTMLGGWADETLSARSWRESRENARWGIARKAIDLIFSWEPQHCFSAYISEAERMQLPPEYRR